MIWDNLQPIPPGVPVLHKLGIEESSLLISSRWQTGPQGVPLRGSTTEVRALQLLLGLSSNQGTLAGMMCALNVPLVSTVPCIRNLQNTIHRFPKGQSPQGKDGLYEEVYDTRNSANPPACYFICSCSLYPPSL